MSAKRLQDISVGTITGFVAALLLSGGKPSHPRREDAHTDSRPRWRATVRQSDNHAQARSAQPQAATLPAPQNPVENDALRVLEERISKGEYVNMFEYPNSWERQKESIQENVRKLARINRTNLTPVFTELGIPDPTSELLQQHVSKINEAAMEVSSMIVQLEQARVDYDRKMRGLLNPEDYQRYRLHEASGAARRTDEEISDFARRERRVVPDGEREIMIAIIRDANAYANEGYLGPYEKLPTVTAGIENGLRNAERRLTAVETGANRALEMAAHRGLSENGIQILHDYYSDDIQKRTAQIARLQDPFLEEKMEAELKRRLEQMARAQGR